MARPVRVLVVDDEPQMQRLLRTSLAAHDYEVAGAETAGAAMRRIRSEDPDLIILDLGLPDRSGLDLIQTIRSTSQIPIIVLSARGDDAAKVASFELGADDYVTKPFSMVELIARIRAALRHRFQEQGVLPVLRCGELSIDLVKRNVLMGEQGLSLTPIEYDLLAVLLENTGKVLTHSFLLKKVWGDNRVSDVQYLRVYIRSLRQKLQAASLLAPIIHTELGVGYRLMPSEPEV
jgi:two-component system KDP operon response regulator KdpE